MRRKRCLFYLSETEFCISSFCLACVSYSMSIAHHSLLRIGQIRLLIVSKLLVYAYMKHISFTELVATDRILIKLLFDVVWEFCCMSIPF